MTGKDGLQKGRLSAFGLRGASTRCPDGLQDLGVPGVLQEGKRPGRYEDAVWLVRGMELFVHDAHLSDGRAKSGACGICIMGPSAILARVKGSGIGDGVVQGAGADAEGAGALPLPVDSDGKGGKAELPRKEGKVQGVERGGLSESERWWKAMLGAPDQSDVGGGNR